MKLVMHPLSVILDRSAAIIYVIMHSFFLYVITL